MSRSTHKLLFILLALMVIATPLQNAIAALEVQLSTPMGPHVMHHTGGGMMDLDVQGKSADCQHCVAGNGCENHDCSLTHCGSCVPGLIRSTPAALTTRSADLYPRIDLLLSDSFTSHPFRPPKA